MTKSRRLAIGLVLVATHPSWGQAEPPLDPDVPLILVRTPTQDLLRVLGGLHPVIPARALAGELSARILSADPVVAAVGPSLLLEDLLRSLPPVPPLTTNLGATPSAQVPTVVAPPVPLGAPHVAPVSIVPRPVEVLVVEAKPLVDRTVTGGREPLGVEPPARPVGEKPSGRAVLLDERVNAALVRINAGDRSPAVMMVLAEVDRETVLYLISLTENSQPNHALIDAMTRLLCEQHGLTIEAAARLDDQVRLKIGWSLARQTDPLAVPILNGLLTSRGPGDGPVPELEALAVYYRGLGDPLQAARTQLRVDDWTTNPAARANLRVGAARDLRRAGDRQASDALYRKIASYGYGWATGLSICDRAIAFLHEAQYQQGLAVLAEPVSGEYADQVGVTIELLRGRYAEAVGDQAAAASHYHRTVELYQSIGRPLDQEGLAETVKMARQKLASRAK